MSNTAIHCESVGKRYRLGEAPTLMLREALMKRLTAPFARRNAARNGEEMLWALRDVSFDIPEGQIVGMIGRNGAGKSTLLKVLSRITEPTTGKAEVRGRVGSLLEVGTGFHPELTGRENIYLNGAILGMRKAEIARKFDEIVAFAEIERFLDTPVKHYSSGMYVRLAFAVAAHLDPEILLVDEVLAVGDATFQKKCFDRVRAIGRSGRTILFVSHNMAAVRQLCQRGIILEHGRVIADGEVNKVIDSYLATVYADSGATASETASCFLDNVTIRPLAGPVIKTAEAAEIRVRFTPKVAVDDGGVYVCIQTLDGGRVAGLRSRDFLKLAPIPAGQAVEIGFSFDQFPLMGGTYQLEVHFQDAAGERWEPVPQYFRFDVAPTMVYGGRQPDHWAGWVKVDATVSSSHPSASRSCGMGS